MKYSDYHAYAALLDAFVAVPDNYATVTLALHGSLAGAAAREWAGRRNIPVDTDTLERIEPDGHRLSWSLLRLRGLNVAVHLDDDLRVPSEIDPSEIAY